MDAVFSRWGGANDQKVEMPVVPLAEDGEDENRHAFPAPQLTAHLTGKQADNEVCDVI